MKLKLKENNIQKTLFGNVFSEKRSATILFYDYDGTPLYSYSENEFSSLSGLPSLPDRTSENLTCDGWNWRLEDIRSQIDLVGGAVIVGAIYHTTDNKTHITCKPNETYPQASICLTPTTANAVTIDWGDGSSVTLDSNVSNQLKTHTYTGVTDSSVYDITVSCSAGTYSIGNYFAGSSTNNQNCIYTDVKLSNKVTSLNNSCFKDCRSLKYINIPSSVDRFGQDCFNNCYSLQSIVIPNTITTIPYYCFYYCYSLKCVSLPNSVIKFDGYCFNSCSSLYFISIPIGTNSFGYYCFSNCYSLQYINIPSSVTIIGSQCFSTCKSLKYINTENSRLSSVGEYAFYSCSSLHTIVLPNTTTYIGRYCFNSCSSLRKIYIQRETPPTLADYNAIVGTVYVPKGSLATYQSASNWSNQSGSIDEFEY